MRRPTVFAACVIVVLCFASWDPSAADLPAPIESALARAGENRAEIQAALDGAPAAQADGMTFLVANMPKRDLTSLSARFLLENVRLAYRAHDESPWKDRVPTAVFLNNVLPYASINERRDDWRADFFERFKPLVKDADSPGAAGAILNQKIFALLDVRYSRRRPKADQSPYESIEAHLASCTGLSVLLIDACRSVGVPARFAGTPMWSDRSGNHSWVEIWDDGWHFTGAAEPSGEALDRAWFAGRAATARRDHPMHAIFAVSYKRTPQRFPLLWDSRIDYVYAVNVTDRYTAKKEELPEGMVRVMVRVLDRPDGDRCAAAIELVDAEGRAVFSGKTNDERFDGNDHLVLTVREGLEYEVRLRHDGRTWTESISADESGRLFTFYPKDDAPAEKNPGPSPETATSSTSATSADVESDAFRDASKAAVESLDTFLEKDRAQRAAIAEQAFASVPLTREDAAAARQLLWKDHAAGIRDLRAAEMKERRLRDGDLAMPFFYQVFGEKPEKGRSLFISMHGGGGAPKVVNDRQWENQKRLYRPDEGVYLVPRAPTDTWNLWHQGHVDKLFDRLIANLIVFEDVDPNRVYLLGYSAGGDGVYQLAPRMADRLAAASMMAGHPNETSPLGLRNLAFAIYCGGRDSAYNRNKIAAQWKEKLAALHEADPQGYRHQVTIYPDKGHWMDRRDASALPWMAQFRRDTLPKRIVWKQDDVTHARFYWLAVDAENRKARSEVTAALDGRRFDVKASDLTRLTIRLSDDMLDLDTPIEVTSGGDRVFEGRVDRTIGTLAATLAERGDPTAVFCAEVTVELPKESE